MIFIIFCILAVYSSTWTLLYRSASTVLIFLKSVDHNVNQCLLLAVSFSKILVKNFQFCPVGNSSGYFWLVLFVLDIIDWIGTVS